MAEWVILQYPQVILLALGAGFLNRFDRDHEGTRGVFTLLSAVIMIIAAALLLLNGAGLREVIALLSLFLLMNMGGRK